MSTRGALREISKWREVERDSIALLTAGVSLAAPLAVGEMTDHLVAGTLASLGVLLMSSSGWSGSLRTRAIDLANTLAMGAVALGIGLFAARHGIAQPVIIGIAALAGVVGGINRSMAKLSTQGLVFAIIGWSDAGVPLPSTDAIGWFFAGSVGAAAMILLVSALQTRADGASSDWVGDLARWRDRMRTPTGWRFPIDLTICAALAVLVTRIWPAPHAIWAVLTVSLVVQRDRKAAQLRTFERGLGTALGVLIAEALLNEAVPVAVVIASVGVIGAIRPHVKLANYTLYAALMTPLVVLLTTLGRPRPPGLLSARLEYTFAGCVIGLVLGAVLDVLFAKVSILRGQVGSEY